MQAHEHECVSAQRGRSPASPDAHPIYRSRTTTATLRAGGIGSCPSGRDAAKAAFAATNSAACAMVRELRWLGEGDERGLRIRHVARTHALTLCVCRQNDGWDTRCCLVTDSFAC